MTGKHPSGVEAVRDGVVAQAIPEAETIPREDVPRTITAAQLEEELVQRLLRENPELGEDVARRNADEVLNDALARAIEGEADLLVSSDKAAELEGQLADLYTRLAAAENIEAYLTDFAQVQAKALQIDRIRAAMKDIAAMQRYIASVLREGPSPNLTNAERATYDAIAQVLRNIGHVDASQVPLSNDETLTPEQRERYANAPAGTGNTLHDWAMRADLARYILRLHRKQLGFKVPKQPATQPANTGRVKLAPSLDEEAQAKLVSDLIENDKTRPEPLPSSELNPFQRKLQAGWLALRASLEKFWLQMQTADGLEETGLWQSTFLTPLTQGREHFYELQEATKAERSEISQMLDEVRARHPAPIHGTALGRPVTGEELVAIALNWGAEGNREAIRQGALMVSGQRRQLTDTEVEAMLQQLYEDDWRVVQKIWDLFAGYHNDLKALKQTLDAQAGLSTNEATELGFVKAKPFVITGKSGQEFHLRGGYYPLMYEQLQKEEMVLADDAQGDPIPMPLYERAWGGARVDINLDPYSFQQVLEHVHRSLSFSHIRRHLQSILRDPKMETHIAQTQGVERLRHWRRMLIELDLGERPPTDWVSKASRFVRHNGTLAYLAFNLSTAAVQMTGFAASLARLGREDMYNATVFVANDFSGARNLMQEKSVTMRARGITWLREHYEMASTRSVLDRTPGIAQLRKYGFAPIVWMQTIVDTITWYGGYHKALRRGDSDAEAVRYADRTVVETQSSAETEFLSPLQRGTELEKMLVMFGSFGLAMHNMNVAKFRQARVQWTDGQMNEAVWDMGTYALIVAFLPAIAETLLRDGLDEPEDVWRVIAGEPVAYALTGIPLARDAASSWVGGYQYGGPSPFVAMRDFISLPASFQDGGPSLKSMISVGGWLAGLPASQYKRTIDAVDGFYTDRLGPLDLALETAGLKGLTIEDQ